MNLLLDTHVLLWWLSDDASLTDRERDAIADGRNLVFASVATIWEIVIKQALGKLVLPEEFREVLAEQPFRWLDITAAHAFQIRTLHMHHRDPFDRMLIAQSQVENLMIMTHDAQIAQYDVPIFN